MAPSPRAQSPRKPLMQLRTLEEEEEEEEDEKSQISRESSIEDRELMPTEVRPAEVAREMTDDDELRGGPPSDEESTDREDADYEDDPEDGTPHPVRKPKSRPARRPSACPEAKSRDRGTNQEQEARCPVFRARAHLLFFLWSSLVLADTLQDVSENLHNPKQN